MNNPLPFEPLVSFYHPVLRTTALVLLVTFSVAVFFSFSLFIPLRPTPAQAFFGVDALIIIAFAKIWHFMLAVAKVMALRIAIRIAMGLLAKLEGVHTIRNMMYYADALGFTQYVGERIDKSLGLNGANPDSPNKYNLKNMIGNFAVMPIANQFFTRDSLDHLANGKQLTGPMEAQMLRGAAAMLTRQGSCVAGVSASALSNISYYFASKQRGFSMSDLNPSNGTDFYKKLAMYGNPFANQYYTELTLRDYAAGVDADAQQATNQELLSQGLKSGRDLNGNSVMTAAGAINSRVTALIEKAFHADNSAADASWALVIGNIIGDFIGQYIVNNAITVTQEQYQCGVPARGVNYALFGAGGGSTGNFNANVTLLANGQQVAAINPGDSATLTWTVAQASGPVTVGTSNQDGTITPLPACPASGASGTCTVKPTASTIYGLAISGEELAEASVTVDQTGGGGGGSWSVATDQASNITANSVVASGSVTNNTGTAQIIIPVMVYGTDQNNLNQRMDPTGGVPPAIAPGATTDFSFSKTGLLPNTHYYFQMQAYDFANQLLGQGSVQGFTTSAVAGAFTTSSFGVRE